MISHYLGQIANETISFFQQLQQTWNLINDFGSNSFIWFNWIKPNKAIRHKNIPTKTLKEFKTELSETLSDVINVIFQ